MSIPTRIALFGLASALSFVACAKPGDVRSSRGSAAPGDVKDSTPVAKINGQTITSGELVATIKGPIGRAEAEHAQQVHSLKTKALDELIQKRLVEAKAKAEGITSEALLKREIEDKIPTPTDAEVQAYYDQVKAQRNGQVPPFDQVKPQVAAALKHKNSEEVSKTFYGKLETDAKVEKMMPPLLLPKVEVAAVGPSKGDAKAPITIVEFSDYQCPFCSRAEESVTKVMEAYKGKVRVFFRDYPLPFHDKAVKASEAAHCAGDQGKYWEMHGKLFANQQALDVPQLKEHAKAIGVDAAKFDKCLDSGEKAKLVEEGKKAGEEAGVSGTPAFFINGRPLSGAQPFEKFKEIIDYELAQK